MLGSLFSDIARESWSNVPNHSILFTNDSNGNPTEITYKDGENVVFIKNLTYDANGNVTSIVCSSPNSNN